jgi:hypothetical protein
VNHRLHHPRFIDEALGLQVVKDASELACVLSVLGQLAFELGARVFAAGQQSQSPTFE